MSIAKEIIRVVLKQHPKDCIFKPCSLESILITTLGCDTEFKLINQIHKSILEHEIYCPHEGIDKR